MQELAGLQCGMENGVECARHMKKPEPSLRLVVGFFVLFWPIRVARTSSWGQLLYLQRWMVTVLSTLAISA